MTAKILPRTWAPIITGILEKPPRDQYEASLMPMLFELMAPDAIHQYCAQWFPDSGRETGDAFIAWRKRHEVMQKDVTAHSTAMWLSNAGDWPDAVPRIRPALRKQMVEELLSRFDARPVEESRKECKDFPRQLASRAWDLERKFKTQLAVMRAHPLGTTS